MTLTMLEAVIFGSSYIMAWLNSITQKRHQEQGKSLIYFPDNVQFRCVPCAPTLDTNWLTHAAPEDVHVILRDHLQLTLQHSARVLLFLTSQILR